MINLVNNLNNLFKEDHHVWVLKIYIDFQYLDDFDQLLSEFSNTVTLFEDSAITNCWQVQAFFNYQPAIDDIYLQIKSLAAELFIQAPLISYNKLLNQDWVEQNQKDFPAFSVANYFIHNALYSKNIPSFLIGIRINAARSFGTGEHQTTKGCLQALGWLSKSYKFNNALDLGCGTGILAIAIAKTWKKPTTAVDLDNHSVITSKINAKINKVHNLVNIKISDGYYAIDQALTNKFDLIVANILSGPLIKLAPMTKKFSKIGAVVILSGILISQEQKILATYLLQRFFLVKRIRIAGWSTLVLKNYSS